MSAESRGELPKVRQIFHGNMASRARGITSRIINVQRREAP